jgi:hypothetical protein
MKAATEAAAGGPFAALPPEYLVLMVRAQAEITVEFINAHPESASASRELGFQMLWNGLAGQ